MRVLSRPRLLDLFCGAGGASRGYHRAGFEVVGVDIRPQPNYPFEFYQWDALEAPLTGFDAVHASPPCQRYSVALKSHNGRANEWPDLIARVRDRLLKTGLPFVIENAAGARAELRDPVLLCGTMFSDLRVIRHRLFECHGFRPWQPVCNPHPLCHTLDKRKAHYGKTDEWVDFVQVNGGGNSSKEAAADAMKIWWMKTKHELNEAIPPAYTQFIGKHLLEVL